MSEGDDLKCFCSVSPVGLIGGRDPGLHRVSGRESGGGEEEAQRHPGFTQS